MVLVVTLTFLHAAPTTWVQSIGGAPVGVMTLTRRGALMEYQVVHVFKRKRQRFHTRWRVDANGLDEDGRLAELQALAQGQPGCRPVREERSGRTEMLCLSPGGRDGSIDGVSIRLGRTAGGALQTVEVLGRDGHVVSRFEAKAASLQLRTDPFERGFAVTGHSGSTVVANDAAIKRVDVSPVGEAQVSDDDCLEAARRVAAREGGAVQLGLIVEKGKAWPHGWVRLPTGGLVDPTRTETGAEARQYLAFPTDRAAMLYLELLSGSVVLTWAP
jgi:hypothetical protein